MTLIQLVEPLIAASLRILLNAETVDFLVFPFTDKFSAIGPSVSSKALNKSIFVVTCIGLIIGPFLNSVSISFASDVVSKEGAAVRPRLRSDSILQALFELALIAEEVDVS